MPETLKLERQPQLPEQAPQNQDARPELRPVAPEGHQPFYALDETAVRAEIAKALSEKPVEAPFIYLTTHDWENDKREPDVNKAYAQAHAEYPYRMAAKAAWDESLELFQSIYSVPGGRVRDMLRRPIVTLKAIKKSLPVAALETKAENAAQIVGETYDRMVAAALPFVPKLPVTELFKGSTKPEESSGATNGHKAEQKSPLAVEILCQQLRLDGQLAEQIAVLSRSGIVHVLETGEQGTVDSEGHEYPAPTPAQLRELVIKNTELIKYKAQQGFTRLLAVPTTVPHETFAAHMQDRVLAHFREDALVDDRGETIPFIEYYKTHELEKRKLVDHVPTRLQDLDDTQSNDHPLIAGWKVVLVKNMPEVSQQKNELVFMGGRPEFLPGAKPKTYAAILDTHPALRGEKGLTFDMWYTYALSELERNDTLIDYRGGTLLLGSYIPGQILGTRKSVPWIGWQAHNKKGNAISLAVGAQSARQRDIVATLGVRTAVELR